ncbi:MAG: V4R domain-containing protein, partial [Psychrobacter sp.]
VRRCLFFSMFSQFYTAPKNDVISLIKCPFCKLSDSNHSGCHFVVGYIEGFLASNPAVKDAQVRETSCGAGSTNICEFTIW